MLGMQIREARRAKDISQGALAAKAKIRQSYLCDIEAGRGNPTVEVLIRIADGLGKQITLTDKAA